MQRLLSKSTCQSPITPCSLPYHTFKSFVLQASISFSCVSHHRHRNSQWCLLSFTLPPPALIATRVVTLPSNAVVGSRTRRTATAVKRARIIVFTNLADSVPVARRWDDVVGSSCGDDGSYRVVDWRRRWSLSWNGDWRQGGSRRLSVGCKNRRWSEDDSRAEGRSWDRGMGGVGWGWSRSWVWLNGGWSHTTQLNRHIVPPGILEVLMEMIAMVKGLLLPLKLLMV